VLHTFALEVLSVPLLFWRENGRDCGRACVGVATTATSSSLLAVDALSSPALLFPLLEAIAKSFAAAAEVVGVVCVGGCVLGLGLCVFGGMYFLLRRRLLSGVQVSSSSSSSSSCH
jgi:hypothetical protein